VAKSTLIKSNQVEDLAMKQEAPMMPLLELARVARKNLYECSVLAGEVLEVTHGIGNSMPDTAASDNSVRSVLEEINTLAELMGSILMETRSRLIG
jgi:hypothetical protein